MNRILVIALTETQLNQGILDDEILYQRKPFEKIIQVVIVPVAFAFNIRKTCL